MAKELTNKYFELTKKDFLLDSIFEKVNNIKNESNVSSLDIEDSILSESLEQYSHVFNFEQTCSWNILIDEALAALDNEDNYTYDNESVLRKIEKLPLTLWQREISDILDERKELSLLSDNINKLAEDITAGKINAVEVRKKALHIHQNTLKLEDQSLKQKYHAQLNDILNSKDQAELRNKLDLTADELEFLDKTEDAHLNIDQINNIQQKIKSYNDSLKSIHDPISYKSYNKQFRKIKSKLSDLINNWLDTVDLNFQEDIKNLIKLYEAYFEKEPVAEHQLEKIIGEISQNKINHYDMNSIFQLISKYYAVNTLLNSDDVSVIEKDLLAFDNDEYINLGSENYKYVVFRLKELLNSGVLQTDNLETVESAIVSVSRDLEQLLNTVNAAENVIDLEEAITELNKLTWKEEEILPGETSLKEILFLTKIKPYTFIHQLKNSLDLAKKETLFTERLYKELSSQDSIADNNIFILPNRKNKPSSTVTLVEF